MTYPTLHYGAGDTTDKGCLVQHAAVIHAQRHDYIDQLPIDQILTDEPCWLNGVVNHIAVFCNDRYPETPEGNRERQRLAPLLERVLQSSKRPPDIERRINARILCHQARKVLHLIPDKHRDVCEAAIASREAWLAGEATEQDCQEAAGAARAAWAAEAVRAGRAAEAAGAARAAWGANAAGAVRAAEAAEAAGAAEAAEAAVAAREPDWVEWLDEVLDVWEKAAIEEDALIDDSEAERLVAEFCQTGGG